MFQASRAKMEQSPMDPVQLSTHILIWLTSPEGGFLKDKSVWAYWHVVELKALGTEIQSRQQMTRGVVKQPHSHVS